MLVVALLLVMGDVIAVPTNFAMRGTLMSLAWLVFLITYSCDGFADFAAKLSFRFRDAHRQNNVLQSVPDNRVQSRRWNGNYKTAIKKLAEIPKKKKMKLDLVANGVTKTVEKKRQESLQHVLTKAIIWKLFMDEYPNLQIEYDIGDPDYLPDVVHVSDEGHKPAFWGESGRMKVHKAVDLMQRYPETHIVHCRWGMNVGAISQPLEDHLLQKFESGELDLSGRKGKFSFCSLPLDVWRYIDDQSGVIFVEKKDLEWKELIFPQ